MLTCCKNRSILAKVSMKIKVEPILWIMRSIHIVPVHFHSYWVYWLHSKEASLLSVTILTHSLHIYWQCRVSADILPCCWNLPSSWQMSSQCLWVLMCEYSPMAAAHPRPQMVQLWDCEVTSTPAFLLSLFSCRSEMCWRSKLDIPIAQEFKN